MGEPMRAIWVSFCGNRAVDAMRVRDYRRATLWLRRSRWVEWKGE